MRRANARGWVACAMLVFMACAPTKSLPVEEPPPAGCTPTTCEAEHKDCGQIPDGCGGTLSCGSCPAGQVCGGRADNICSRPCTPTTCVSQGANCGQIQDGCFAVLDCGTCPEGETCGGGGRPNVCGNGPCIPTTCQALGLNCGEISDGCGFTLSCGTCALGQSCGGGGTPNVCAVPTVPILPLCSKDGFCLFNPLPTDDRLMATWGVAPEDFWAVGGAVGAPAFIQHWVNNSVTLIPSPYELQGIWGSGPNDIWAVGNVILHWDGTLWSVAVDQVGLLDVWGTAANDVWAVGFDGLVMHWDGRAWTRVESGTVAPLLGVWASSPRDVWVVSLGEVRRFDGTSWRTVLQISNFPYATTLWGSGPDDVWVGLQHVEEESKVLHWNGTTWQDVPLPPELRRVQVEAIRGAGPNDVWMVGSLGIRNRPVGFIARWNGSAWRAEQVEFPAALNGLWVTGMDPLAMGQTGPKVWAVGDHGSVLTRFEGSWRSLTRPVFFASAAYEAASNDVWFVGFENAEGKNLAHWDGSTLTRFVFPNFSLIHGSAPNNIWAAAQEGQTAHWDGRTWTQLETPAPGFLLFGLWVNAPDDAWISGRVGPESVTFRWNGTRWERIPFPAAVLPLALWGSGPSDVWATGAGLAHFDGTAWTQVRGPENLPRFQALWGSGPTDIWLVGASGAESTSAELWHWDGAQLAPFPHPPVTGGFAGVDFLSSIWGRSAHDVYTVGSAGNVLHWDGAAWSRVDVGPYGTFFVTGGANDVWILGNGPILRRER